MMLEIYQKRLETVIFLTVYECKNLLLELSRNQV